MKGRELEPPGGLGGEGPVLRLDDHKPILVDRDWYPAPLQISSAEVLDQWLEHVDQALVDTRNGVTAISWPLAVGVFLAAAAIFADGVDQMGADKLLAPDGLAQLFWTVPGHLLICLVLGGFGALVVGVTNEATSRRRLLVRVRAAYLRRRQQLAGHTNRFESPVIVTAPRRRARTRSHQRVRRL